jgi:LmbE family N-acetylglucosaminyl deacetylase
MLVQDDASVERVLVVTAHPDDLDFGAGATIAKWTAAGIAVSYCILTDGDAGGFDEAVPRSEIPGIRRAEQTAAGRELGVTDITFLGYPDGRLTASYDVRRDISRVIRQVRPQRVLCQSPERNWLRIGASHPDHLAAGEAALCAVYPDARNPFAHPELYRDEGLAAYAVPEVWIMGHPQSDTFVDVTDTFERKVEALRRHESQTAHMEDLEGMLRTWLVRNAAVGNLPPGRLAEAYKVIHTA